MPSSADMGGRIEDTVRRSEIVQSMHIHREH
jgi:hypothetical protein